MGDSGHRDTYTYDVRGREALAVAEHAGMSNSGTDLIIVSHSYGAVVALNAIRQGAGLIHGLVACEPLLTHPSKWDELEPGNYGRELSRPPRIFPDLQSAVDRFRFAPSQPCKNPALQEYVAVHSLKRADDGWCWKYDPRVYSSYEEGHSDWGLTHSQDFVDLALPKALIHGAESAFLSIEVAHAIARLSKVPVPVLSIQQAHHHLMVDEPVSLASAIEAMVDSIAALSAR